MGRGSIFYCYQIKTSDETDGIFVLAGRFIQDFYSHDCMNFVEWFNR